MSASLGPLELSLLDGERSKDCGCSPTAPSSPVSLLTASDEDAQLRRGGVDLPSRAAEHFFWLGRHAVRAESLAQAAPQRRRAAGQRRGRRAHPRAAALLRVLAEQGQIEPGYVVDEIRSQLPAIEKQLPKSAFDDGPPARCARRSPSCRAWPRRSAT